MNVGTQRPELHSQAEIVAHGNIRGTERFDRGLDLDRYQLLTAPTAVYAEEQTCNGDKDHDAQPLPVHEDSWIFLLTGAIRIRPGNGQI
jgi:hypothetical protein